MYNFNCPKCKAELSAEVDYAEHLLYFDKECDECGYKFTEAEYDFIYDKAMIDGFSSLIDRAEMYYADR